MKIRSIFISLVLTLVFVVSSYAEIVFKNDKNYFTLWAYLNYTGYDKNNLEDPNEYHPIRQEVRDYMININESLTNNNTGWNDISDFGGMEGDYSFTLVQMSGNLPYLEDRYNDIWSVYVHGDLEKLNLSLNEFYTKFNINQLWLDVQDDYDILIEEYEIESEYYINKVLEYFKINIDNYSDFWIIPNPLCAFWFGMAININDKIEESNNNPIYLNVGLDYEGNVNISNIIHELAHIFEGPSVRNYNNLNNLVTAMSIKHPDIIGKTNYASMEKIINESFARAISAWSLNDVDNADTETESGFVITRFIYDEISNFNNYNNFEDWVHSTLDEYKKTLDIGSIYTQEDLDNAFEEGRQACISDPLSCGIGKLILFHSSSNPTIPSNMTVSVYGTSNTNMATMEQSSRTTFINYKGNNIFTIKENSDNFTIYRTGTIVYFESNNGTLLRIPASTNIQTIEFNDRSVVLNIYNGKIMLDDQVITLNPSYIE